MNLNNTCHCKLTAIISFDSRVPVYNDSFHLVSLDILSVVGNLWFTHYVYSDSQQILLHLLISFYESLLVLYFH